MLFRSDDFSIDYSDNGNGLPVVLVHGFGNDRLLWQPQIDALSSRYRIITVDLRGYGGSSDATGVTIDRYADDIIALLDHLGIQRAVIGGISLGGYVTLSIALRHTQRAIALVLANTRAGADNPEWARFREQVVSDIEKRGAPAVAEIYGDKPLRPDAPQWLKDILRAMMLRQPPGGLAASTRAMARRPDRTASIASIELPTLIISGTADAYIPSTESAAMNRAIAGSVFVDIPDAGHLSNVDTPAEFNQVLDDFLRPLAKEFSK